MALLAAALADDGLTLIDINAACNAILCFVAGWEAWSLRRAVA